MLRPTSAVSCAAEAICWQRAASLTGEGDGLGVGDGVGDRVGVGATVDVGEGMLLCAAGAAVQAADNARHASVLAMANGVLRA